MTEYETSDQYLTMMSGIHHGVTVSPKCFLMCKLGIHECDYLQDGDWSKCHLMRLVCRCCRGIFPIEPVAILNNNWWEHHNCFCCSKPMSADQPMYCSICSFCNGSSYPPTIYMEPNLSIKKRILTKFYRMMKKID